MNGLICMAAGKRDLAQQLVREWQLWIEGNRPVRELLGHRQIFPAQQHARRHQVPRRRIRPKAILGSKGVTCIVIPSRVHVAKGQHIGRIRFALRAKDVLALKNRDRLGRAPQLEQRQAPHLRRFRVMGVGHQGTAKRRIRLLETVQVVVRVALNAVQPRNLAAGGTKTFDLLQRGLVLARGDKFD